jgi:hypothetical protein
MTVHSKPGWLLFYFPPCGKWYVHSHKIYESLAEAKEAAEKFLHPGTRFCIRSFDLGLLK